MSLLYFILYSSTYVFILHGGREGRFLIFKIFSLKYSEFLSRQIFPLKGKVIISNLEDGTMVHNPWLTFSRQRAAVEVTKNSMQFFDVEFSQNIKLWGT